MKNVKQNNTEARTFQQRLLRNNLAIEETAHGTEVGVLAQVSSHFDAKMLGDKSIVIGSRIGNIVTMRLPIEKLEVLEQCPEVEYYEVARRMAPNCDQTRFDTRTDSVQAGLGLPESIDGSGVIIGITDWGFDYTHINFNNGDNNHRILRAWDHFRTAGPAPEGFDYGTEIVGYDSLIAYQCDTSGLYDYATHGSHVAGICAGRGMGDGKYRGQAPGAQLLMGSFLLGENAWLDQVAWMKRVADEESKRLVINSSWGMYTFSNLDGTSLLSQAINQYSDAGVVFVTSGGNNGDEKCHISRDFTLYPNDTLRTVVSYYSSGIGQALIMWGEPGHDFSIAYGTYDSNNNFITIGTANTAEEGTEEGYMVFEDDSVYCDLLIEHANHNNNAPHILLNVSKMQSHKLHLMVKADSGTVHVINICNLENHAGNMGSAFSSEGRMGYSNGDNACGIGEPACADKAISVAAHKADHPNPVSGAYIPGLIASFSSHGPTIDGRNKPEISAPGVNVISSISAFTTETHEVVDGTFFDGHRHKFAKMSGTSMSGPAVTGIVALMLQANPNLSTDEVREILFTTARNDANTGDIIARGEMSDIWGWGKADAYRAVVAALERLDIHQAPMVQVPIAAYPNPSNGRITIATGSMNPTEVKIFDIEGRQVWSGCVTNETSIDMSTWNAGVYVIRSVTAQGIRTGRIVKE